jgi:serine/threonine-protein kinase
LTPKVCPRCDARFRGDIASCPIDGAALVEPEDPFIGRTIAGRYLVEEQLGSGGMGTVYRARHQIIGRDVALKFLDISLLKNERQRKRFLGEARAANQINHEHIIDITDFGETEDGQVYMVMEYLEGRTLADEIDRGPLLPRRALRIAMQVALGLARAHELGVVHRDIKPANIYLVQKKLDPDYVKILDFGVARIEQDMRITGQGTIVGTPEYIAPEQVRSPVAVPSADLYSLGCVLFEMLTSRLPFEGKTTMLLVKHLNDPPPLPSSLVSSIPKPVDELVMRLLAKDPAARFRDGYHLVEEVQHLLDSLPSASRLPNESSVPAARHASSAPAQTEEDTFYKTVAMYRQLINEVHPNNSAPNWLPQTVAYLENIVMDLQLLRQRLRAVAEKATEQEEESRGPRSRIGRAIDQLAQDESRLGRMIEGLTAELGFAEARLDEEMQGIFQGARDAPIALNEGHALTRAEAQSVARMVSAARRLANARQAVLEARSELAARNEEQRDVRFQMTELKDQLAQLNAASTLDQQFVHDEVTRCGAQIQARLEAMAPYAARVAKHFAQFPGAAEQLEKRAEAITQDGVLPTN